MNNTMRILVASLLAMGAFAATSAQADVLTASGSATAGTTSVFGPTTGSSFVNDGSNVNDATGNMASAYAWGNDHGTYRADSSGQGTFDSTATFHRTLQVINGNAAATQYSLNFFIYYGYLSIENWAGVSGSGATGYDLSIKRNGSTSLFGSSAHLDSLGGLTVINALNGAQLQDTGSGYSYNWNGTYVTLDLGVLGAGESMNIDFDLVTTASGSYAVQSTPCGYYGEYGYGDVPSLMSDAYGGYGGYGGTCYQTAHVNGALGDPSNLSSTLPPGGVNFVVTGSPLNSVPAPGSLSLLGVGLGAMTLARRRRR
ncbi:VPLPA-CTERM sorting domain-containing protein [Zoogloea sp.]|uniref:VPLPA-CTERM sorting domain-containing protein n=1 Tax=Zoogloea sp. TaxID=49181 RepID=UPI0031FD1DEE